MQSRTCRLPMAVRLSVDTTEKWMGGPTGPGARTRVKAIEGSLRERGSATSPSRSRRLSGDDAQKATTRRPHPSRTGDRAPMGDESNDSERRAMRHSLLCSAIFLTLACDGDRSSPGGRGADASNEVDQGVPDGGRVAAACRVRTRAWLAGGIEPLSHAIHRRARTRDHVIDLVVGASSMPSCEE